MSSVESKKWKDQIQLIITSGEKDIIEAMDAPILKKECGHVFYDVEPLLVGDMLFNLNGEAICIIERKAINDYVASMTDGRLKEQTARLIQFRKEHPNIIIMFMIEGAFVKKGHVWKNGVTREAFLTSCMNKIIRDKFYIYRTENHQDTAVQLSKLYDNLPKHWADRDKILTPEEERLKYIKTIKLAKKDNMTPQNCFAVQLAEIPGISVDIGNAISKHYPSWPTLIKAYESQPNVESKENLLSNIPIPIANNKTKKLDILSKRIYDYTYQTNETSNEITTVIETENPPKFKIKLKI